MANPIISLITAADYDIEVYEDDTTGLVMEFYDDNDAPYSLAGAAILLEVKGTIGGALVQDMSTTDGNIVISGGSNNIITIKGWDTLNEGTYYYDLRLTEGTERRTIFKGQVRVTPDA